MSFFHLHFFSGSQEEALEKFRQAFRNKQQPCVVFTPNPEQVVLAHENRNFRQYLQKADILLPDGIGVVIASKMLSPLKGKSAIQQRITGVDVVSQLLQRFPDKKFLVIGGKNYTQSQEKPSKIQVLGREVFWTEGYDDVSHQTAQEEQALEEQVKRLRPDVVMVAFGALFQEEWVIQHLSFLEKNQVKIVMVVGGAFDMLLGKVPRASSIWQNVGLEWLYRLIQQPWRWRRQLNLVKFIGLTVREIFTKN